MTRRKKVSSVQFYYNNKTATSNKQQTVEKEVVYFIIYLFVTHYIFISLSNIIILFADPLPLPLRIKNNNIFCGKQIVLGPVAKIALLTGKSSFFSKLAGKTDRVACAELDKPIELQKILYVDPESQWVSSTNIRELFFTLKKLIWGTWL